MPEYNHGFSAPLKNALDYLNREWADKPVGFVSYGGIAGGTRAVHMIKEVVTTLRMLPVLDSVIIPLAGTMVDADGFHPTPVIEQSATTMLDELQRLATVMQSARGAAASA